MIRRDALVLATAGMIAAGGCERTMDRRPAEDDASPRAAEANVPQALMVRFQEVKGKGSSRESWEVEVLQLGGDIRVRGAVRTGGLSIPILHTMSSQEYVDFWAWLRLFPLARGRPTEDASVPAEGWRKTLAVDVVLDEQTRWKSRTSWTRPLTKSTAWVNDIETRLHTMALDLAHQEVGRQEQEAASPGHPAGSPGVGVPGAALDDPIPPPLVPDDD